MNAIQNIGLVELQEPQKSYRVVFILAHSVLSTNSVHTLVAKGYRLGLENTSSNQLGNVNK